NGSVWALAMANLPPEVSRLADDSQYFAMDALIDYGADLQLGERDGRVLQPGGVDRRAGADDPLDLLGHVPDVDVHPGQHAPVREPERDELTRRHVAAEHDPVVAARLGVAGVLHAEVVLVGEEVRHAVVADLLAEHGPGRGGPAVQRVVPVLDPKPPPQEG